jgi:hypothetical protein
VAPWQGSGAHYAASRALGHATRELVLAAQGQLPAPADDTVSVMAALKSALDPAQVLSPGRYRFGPP